ncbi:hypothetical protein QTP88_013470 [Uroleucon formosanum]
MSNFRNQSFTNYIASLSFKDGSIWKAIKKALKEKPSYPPLKQPNNTWAIEDPVKADLFKPHNNINNPAFSNEIEQSLLSPLQMTLPPKAFSSAEVQYCIDTFPKRKAPDFDLITYEVAKHLARKTLILLTYIFNSIIRLSYFPLQWKFTIIIVIPKSEVGVPQGVITAPAVLFNIFIADQSTSPHTFVAKYADDKAILSTHENPIIAFIQLQSHLSRLESWCRNWKVKINESKSCHITFILKHQICPQIFLLTTS